MKRKSLALLMICVLLMSAMIGCGEPEEIVDSEKRTDVNIYCESVWDSLDPHGEGCTNYANMYLANQLYEALIYVDDSSEIQPMLAESWTISDDGLVYTFTLREDVKFHNGEMMEASDVVYSFHRAMSEGYLEGFYAPIEKIEEKGDNKVAITLKYAFAPITSYLMYIPVVCESFCQEHGLRTEACGTGAYQLVSIDLNRECRMKAFSEYWGGEPSIQDVTFKVISDAESATAALENGDIDFMMCYDVSSYTPLEESGKYNTELAPTFHTAFIALNNTVEPLKHKLVRQALSHATDRQTMIDIAYEGLAEPAYLMANPSCFGVSEEQFFNHYEYDLNKAKTLLKLAGYPNGLDLGKMTVIKGTYHEKYARVWQQSLAQIGVTVELVGSETAISDYLSLNYTTCTMGEGFRNDFAYCSMLYTPKNSMGYDNPKVTQLFDLARKELDSNKRLEYYGEAIDIIYDECPCIPLFNKEVPYVWDKGLNANPHSDSGHPYFVREMSWK